MMLSTERRAAEARLKSSSPGRLPMTAPERESAARMYISHVRLENIRGFSGHRKVNLTLKRPDGSYAGWTVLAGRNGSGKTSLLRAIALTVAGPSIITALTQDLRPWITKGQQQAVSEVRLSPTWEQDGLGNPANAAISDLAMTLTWTIPADSKSSRSPMRPSLSSSVTPDAGADNPWDPDGWGWFCAAYGPFRRLTDGAADVQRFMSAPSPVARLASLFYEDVSLREGVQWLIDMHLRELEGKDWARDLKEDALKILADGLFPDEYRISNVDSDGLWVNRGRDLFPLREMSDGYRTVAALVVDLIKQLHDTYGTLDFAGPKEPPAIKNPGVVLIDEVDAHLHVSWQQRIGGWLKTHFPGIQFIVTTHSPYICQAADLGGLIRLPGPGERRQPQVVDQGLYERVVYGSGDDAVLSELFGLESPYSKQAEELRQELVALELKVIAGQASKTEVTEYHELRRRLNSSPVARADEVAARLRPPGESAG
jgi:hypothetical protein